VQHEVVHRRSGIVADSERVTIPALQRITPQTLRAALRLGNGGSEVAASVRLWVS
jgi:hypothetical protein